MTLRTCLAVGALAVARAAPTAKRGVVADGCTGTSCTDGALLSNLGWYYDYNVADPWYGSSVANEAVKFTPMHWCIDDVNTTVPSYVNLTYMMGYNEPNNAHNCNKDAKTAAASWGQVMAKWPNSKLVSPATAGDGRVWLQQFFDACKSLYGPTGCNISYVAVHDYSCTPSDTMKYLQQVYDLFKLPVWLTEFSCGDGAQKRPTKDHITFMKGIVPLLDSASFVYRYAWMSCRSDQRGLVAPTGPGGQAELTELGQLYNTM